MSETFGIDPALTKRAIEAGDAATAWENAKKVKTFCLIGVAINILMVMFSCGVNS